MTDPDPAVEPLPSRSNHPYDAPDAAALIGAVRSYLHDDLLNRTTGADRWLVRIAANALSIAEREIASADGHRQAHRDRLHALDVHDDAELATAIRRGDFDDRWEEVRDAIAASVVDSLSVANPGYVR